MPVDADNKSKQKVGVSNSRFVLEKTFLLLRQYGGSVIWGSVAVYTIGEIASVLKTFAGRTSVASLVFSIAARVSFAIKLSVVVAGLSTALYFYEHWRHLRTRERLTERIVKLEKRIDAGRTSSGLTTRGKTRAGDL